MRPNLEHQGLLGISIRYEPGVLQDSFHHPHPCVMTFKAYKWLSDRGCYHPAGWVAMKTCHQKNLGRVPQPRDQAPEKRQHPKYQCRLEYQIT